MSTERFLGIDPGCSGGVALLCKTHILNTWTIARLTRHELFTVLQNSIRGAGLDHYTYAFIEKVHAMPKQGVSSTFKFGVAYGEQRMALVAAGIPFDEVLPRKWQQAAGLSYPKGSTQTERKNLGKQRAQELYPGIKVTHAIADALLIASACRIMKGGLNGE